jgi:hypothetical protein
MKTIAIISRQVIAEDRPGCIFRCKKLYIGLKRLQRRNDKTRMDQKG